MIQNLDQLQVTMQQIGRLIRALEDLKANVLPQNPALFATLAEAPLEDLDRLREEVSNFVHELKPSA
jgi:ribosomal 50S subunit-associated protein YjgA (DUF615 family)